MSETKQIKISVPIAVMASSTAFCMKLLVSSTYHSSGSIVTRFAEYNVEKRALFFRKTPDACMENMLQLRHLGNEISMIDR